MLLKVWSVLSFAVALASGADTYDYIIVGGGTAGNALATRLSLGLPRAKILLLEAGPAAPDDLRINVPGLRGSTLGSELDWNFATTPQQRVQNRTIDVNRGKVLGGSSALNFLCYDRASVAEYDALGELGNKDWGWKPMIDAMVKSENFTSPDNNIHGRDGPIRGLYNRMIPDFLNTWQPTLNKLGVPSNDRSLSGDPIGVMFQPTNIDPAHWNRSYSANSYIPLAGKNLVIKTNTRVAKVDFGSQQKGRPLQAVGVTLEDGTKIAACKEVILSAGAVQTPGLLELSGIGQTQVLKKANIATLIDLPGVGENYQDHVRISNTYRLKGNVTTLDALIHEPNGDFSNQQMALWLANKPSWFDYTSIAYSFLNVGHFASKDAGAELLRLARKDAAPSSVIDQKKLEWLNKPSVPQLEIIMEANYVAAGAYPGGKYMTFLTAVMHPMSRGSVHISATSPTGKPVIDPRYFTNDFDRQALIAGAKFARKIAMTEPMASLWDLESDPGQGVQTDDQWRDFAEKNMLSFYHPVGTAAMLPKKDGGVVDSSLTVYGTSNLRVVDNSILPLILSAHIQTAAYAIAEIAAEMIIDDA